jgi:hypothetical protein
MNIQIEINIDAENKEVYQFHLSDTKLLFWRYDFFNKPKGKKNWTALKVWDNSYSRNNTIEKPKLSEAVKDAAKWKVFDSLTVGSFSELK